MGYIRVGHSTPTLGLKSSSQPPPAVSLSLQGICHAHLLSSHFVAVFVHRRDVGLFAMASVRTGARIGTGVKNGRRGSQTRSRQARGQRRQGRSSERKVEGRHKRGQEG